MKTNVLYYGDNLEILQKYIPDDSVDLVYLDPPFNSNQNYNVIFKDESGRQRDAQLIAFEDTWHRGPDAEMMYVVIALPFGSPRRRTARGPYARRRPRGPRRSCDRTCPR